MTDGERHELLKSVICHADNGDDDDLRIFEGMEKHAGTDVAVYGWDTVILRLYGSPSREIWFDSLGEITHVAILKWRPMDKPDKIALSEENWNVPEIDRALLEWARSKAEKILDTVKMFGGETRSILERLEDQKTKIAEKDSESPTIKPVTFSDVADLCKKNLKNNESLTDNLDKLATFNKIADQSTKRLSALVDDRGESLDVDKLTDKATELIDVTKELISILEENRCDT